MNDESEGFCIDCDRIVPLIFKRRKVEQTEKGISFSYSEDYAICMHCGGDMTKCDFYPTRRARAICEDKATDIFTLLQKVQKKGYELTIYPDELHIGTVRIKLSNPETMRHIDIRMRVDQNYFKDPNGLIFETVDQMIKDMDKYREV